MRPITDSLAFLDKGVILGAYSAQDLTDLLLALNINSPLRLYALSDILKHTFPPMLTEFEIYQGVDELYLLPTKNIQYYP